MKKLLFYICIVFASSCTNETITDEKNTAKPIDTDTLRYNPAEGLNDGVNETRYPNGNLRTKGAVINGNRHGTWESWYENGNKWSESSYEYGALEGKTVSYFPNGQVRYIGYYDNNKKSGKWMTFDETGNLLEEKEYTK